MNNSQKNYTANLLKYSKNINWRSVSTWKTSANNTLWCMLGCTVGNYATILSFQLFFPKVNHWIVFILAPLIGLIVSVSGESLMLVKQLGLPVALKTALGMSFVSMIMMQLMTNSTNYILVGSNILDWWSIIPSLIAGYSSALIYNYYNLIKHGKSCH